MNMLNLFESIKITNADRISPEDKKFCEREQNQYENALNFYKTFLPMLSDANARDTELKDIQDSRFGGYISLNLEDIWENILRIKRILISHVIYYFEKTYSVKLESKKAHEVLAPTEPERKESPWRGSLSDINTESFKRENLKLAQKYQEQVEKYHAELLLSLPYSQIIDWIFLELGGLSFAERAELELIGKCQNLFKGWRCECIKFKKNSVEIADFLRIESQYSWNQGGELDYDSKNVLLYNLLIGLSHFCTGHNQNIFDNFLSHLSVRKGENLICEHELDTAKTVSIRIYKNGKFVIKFKTAAYALEFAKNYCCYKELEV